MKTILITLNILLTSAVLFGGISLFREISGSGKTTFTVRKKKKALAARSTAAVAKVNTEIKNADIDGLSQKIIAVNVFNQERCPNIGVFNNARVELTLVGTFKAGKHSGAIILQKAQNRHFPFMPFGGGPGGGMMPGQGRRQGIERFGNGQNNPRQRSGNAAARRQIGGARNIQATRNANGVVIPGTVNSTLSTTPASYKQYVRVGETLANGYKLVSVERNRALLTRGSDKLELELVDASKNAPKSASRPGRVNQNQVMQQMMRTMQQMQRAQGFQNFQMMRAMQNMNNRPPQGNGGPGRR